MKNILDSHIKFIEKRYQKTLDDISSNIGWVHTGTSITSKIYETNEYISTYWQEGEFNHEAVSM
jgi:hypothetical protein